STVKTISEWGDIMPALIKSAHSIYINSREDDRFQSEILSQNDRMGNELKRLYPSHTFLRAQPLLRELSMIKHPEEIKLISHAISVTGLAFDRVLKTMKPNLKEYEVEAELTYVLAQ